MQGLLDRKTCFKYACNVARYVVPDQDINKCMTSFYSYARELSNMREGIKSSEQKSMFDLEVRCIFWHLLCKREVFDDKNKHLEAIGEILCH